MSQEFDVFLCHNSQDKLEVLEIAQQLQKKGLKPWLDYWELQPGFPWQPELEKQIHNIKSAAVFVGENGTGPWQKMEIDAYLRHFVNQGCAVIPVLLTNAPQKPDLPIFLSGFTWVDFRNAKSNPMGRLMWGITGHKPKDLQISQEYTPKRKLAISPTEEKLEEFDFPIVTLNTRGQAIKLKTGHAKYFTEDLGDGITFDMVEIPGGKFLMGTKDDEIEKLAKRFNWDGFRREKPQHEVAIQTFFIGKHLITQEQWKLVATLPQIERELKLEPSRFQGNNLPVEKVSWDDAVEFCQRLSSETEKQYRLPTEAEWEYACRAMTNTPFYCGKTITDKQANYNARTTYASEPKGEYRQETTPVGSFPPNAFGLYDMHGNLWEWCTDDWHENYEGLPEDGNAWLSSRDSSMKVIRGGSWNNNPWYWLSASRDYNTRDSCISYIGFRVVHVSS
ncbi:MAG: SUMF1/EgtB/PvdO family nonheme iron enzyme [Cyanobacteria bacterium P01_F01_bin.143]